jgi:hypothetical protein
MLIFVYNYIHVTQFNNYMLNFLLRCLFKNSSDFSSIDITAYILRRWWIVYVASEKFGAGLGKWVCSRWLCGGCVWVGSVWLCVKGNKWPLFYWDICNSLSYYNINISEYRKYPNILCCILVNLRPKVGNLSTALFADVMYELSCPFSEKAPVETDLFLCISSPPKLITCSVLKTLYDLYN